MGLPSPSKYTVNVLTCSSSHAMHLKLCNDINNGELRRANDGRNEKLRFGGPSKAGEWEIPRWMPDFIVEQYHLAFFNRLHGSNQQFLLSKTGPKEVALPGPWTWLWGASAKRKRVPSYSNDKGLEPLLYLQPHLQRPASVAMLRAVIPQDRLPSWQVAIQLQGMWWNCAAKLAISAVIRKGPLQGQFHRLSPRTIRVRMSCLWRAC
jgi:hypothetical protein